ncbi:hypothetical protein D3C85_1209700 [compost metagenome]
MRIDLQIDIERRIDRHGAHGCRQQRVAVRRAFGNVVRSNVAAGSGTVLHNDGLLQAQGQLMRDFTRQDVRRSPRRKRHDHAYGLARVVLRACRAGGAQE